MRSAPGARRGPGPGAPPARPCRRLGGVGRFRTPLSGSMLSGGRVASPTCKSRKFSEVVSPKKNFCG